MTSEDKKIDEAIASLSLIQRLHAIMSELTGLGKSGTAPSSVGGFSYVRHADVSAAVQPLLVKYGVMAIPTKIEPEYETYETPKGKMFHTRVMVTLSFYCTDPGAPHGMISIQVPGNALNRGDKGLGAAISYAIKYGLLKLFMIPTEDDDDIERRGETLANAHTQRAVPPGGSEQSPFDPGAAKGSGEKTPKAECLGWLVKLYPDAKSAKVATPAIKILMAKLGIDQPAVDDDTGEAEPLPDSAWNQITEFVKGQVRANKKWHEAVGD